MYGITVCAQCQRKRIIDMRNESSVCPYCNTLCKIDRAAILFSDISQSVVRNAFKNADASKYPEPKKKGSDPDPLSTLIREYERTTGIVEKLTVLANGLTKLNGTFTHADVEDLFPGKATDIIRSMNESGIVFEPEHGRYKAI
ncbi:MAG: hypothetical protein FWD92_04510 [Methanomassiliicoccaceae archaeon]|nr:hypothetical protein [Methanomassiliicoccaceae archaeon]